jgi:hypothetical protein
VRSRLTLAEFYEQTFRPKVLPLYRKNTRTRYEALWRQRVAGSLGSMRMHAIDEASRRGFARSIELERRKVKGPLAFVRTLLREAAQQGLLEVAPRLPQELIKDAKKLPCNLSIMGGTDRSAFDVFDARLRSAANGNDRDAFADLVIYPLRVNRDRRSIMIGNREEFARNAARIITASVRNDIANQRGFFCRDIGLMYGRGTVWVEVVPASGAQPERYGVSTVNVPDIDSTKTPSPTAPELKLKCVAPTSTVLVEDLGGTLRYRSWHTGQPKTAKPDLTLESGTGTLEGTGLCAHAIYAFKNGDTTYELSELGCSDGSEPDGTTGRLTVSRGGKQLAAWLCCGDGKSQPTR